MQATLMTLCGLPRLWSRSAKAAIHGFLFMAVRVGIQSFLRSSALPLRQIGARRGVRSPLWFVRGVMPA